jgi:DNA-binding NtrC family response regulator
LRNRCDDILPLSEAFLAEVGRGLGRPPSGISRDAKRQLLAYHWPGNVRELRNILERAAILCDGGLIAAEHLAMTIVPPAVAPTLPPPVPSVGEPVATVPRPAGTAPATAGNLQSMERAMIEQALQNARFNKSKAAKTLGLTRHQLYIRMRKYGFE